MVLDNKDLDNILKHTGLDRTEKIFDTVIERTDLHTKDKVKTPDDLRKIQTVLKAGNLHVNSARIHLSAIRFVGYMDNMRKLKDAVQRRTRDSLKPKQDE